METDYSGAAHTAKDYYNSQDADNFYFTIWGGEDIHIGIYQSPEDSIFDASRRTVSRMASLLDSVNKDSRILDIGSGFGGAARYLASTHGCRVVALNLSEVENSRHREMNKEEGLDRLIEVVDGSFEDIPYPDGSFDAVWSQDAILHSGDRVRVLE
jgi:sarcosine/dimethylglycine N-methyltransferase